MNIDETRASNFCLVRNASELRARQDISSELARVGPELLGKCHGEVRLEVTELRIATWANVWVRILGGQPSDSGDRHSECAFKRRRWIDGSGGNDGWDGCGH